METGVKQTRPDEQVPVDRHIAGGEVGPGEVAELVGFAGGVGEIGRIDHRPVGEAPAMACPLPVALQRLGMAAQEGGGHHQVAVDEDDHLPPGVLHAAVAPLGRTAMALLNQPHMGQLSGLGRQPGHGLISGAVVHQNHFKTREWSFKALGFEGPQTRLQDGQPVVGGDNNADEHGCCESDAARASS